jgi:GNAT superfamily N-acetyltransferase
MPETPAFTIRPMRPDDLEQASGLALAEGWNQTMNDWRILFNSPDNVCIIAEKDNRVAGTATALNHDNKVAWIGMVLVDKLLRGQGAGKMLLEEIINRVKHVEAVKLDATPAGEPLYRKLGFIEEYKIHRMTCSDLNYSSDRQSREEIQNISQQNISDILKLDRIIFGVDRGNLLRHLLKENPAGAFFINRDNHPDGYIFGRIGSRFNYIGPLCALTQDSARHLISEVIESLKGQDIALDIPDDKADLINWLETIGFVKQRHFVRMYLGVNPYPGRVSDQYLISGPEFG